MKTPPRGLGRGLSALFSDTEEAYGHAAKFSQEEPASPLPEDIKDLTEVDIDLVSPNPNQPRKHFDEDALNELADSIKKHGLIMPIVVNRMADGKYMIIAGERRYRASRIAGKTKIPVVVREYDDRQIKEISLIENLQREDLNPIEAATAMKQLMDEYHLTQEELAERIGKSRPAVTNTLRLLSLSPEVILCDEIGGFEEVEAVLAMQNSGVPLIATAHGDSPEGILRRSAIRTLVQCRVFGAYVGVRRDPLRGFLHTTGFFDSAGDASTEGGDTEC